MKKCFLILIIVFCAQARTTAHPLHLSVINITIQGKELVISMNTFVDDWETAYYHYHSTRIDLSIPENYRGDWFLTSIFEAFEIREEPGSDPIKLKIENVTFDELSMKIDIQGRLRKAPKTLYIYNAILTDIFPDQNNLVIISLDNKQTGMKFDYKTKQEELQLR